MSLVDAIATESPAAVDDHPPLYCKVDSCGTIAEMLGAVNFRKDLKCHCSASSHGIEFTTNYSGAVVANATVKAALFQEYHCDPNGVSFCVQLSALLECLKLFSSNPEFTSLELRFDTEEQILSLLLEDEGVVSECTLASVEEDGPTDLGFRTSPTINGVILHSYVLREAFEELDWADEEVELELSPDAPYFRLHAPGMHGEFEFMVPRSSDAFLGFKCAEERHHRYRLAMFKYCLRALQTSTDVSIRVNDDGVLCMQFMIKRQVNDDEVYFVQFVICPIADNDEADALAAHSRTTLRI